jgi:hypothetical protein
MCLVLSPTKIFSQHEETREIEVRLGELQKVFYRSINFTLSLGHPFCTVLSMYIFEPFDKTADGPASIEYH